MTMDVPGRFAGELDFTGGNSQLAFDRRPQGRGATPLIGPALASSKSASAVWSSWRFPAWRSSGCTPGSKRIVKSVIFRSSRPSNRAYPSGFRQRFCSESRYGYRTPFSGKTTSNETGPSSRPSNWNCPVGPGSCSRDPSNSPHSALAAQAQQAPLFHPSKPIAQQECGLFRHGVLRRQTTSRPCRYESEPAQSRPHQKDCRFSRRPRNPFQATHD